MALGLDMLTRRADGNRWMKGSITLVRGLVIDINSGNVVCKTRCISTFAADAALYRAKAEGRDRVVAVGQEVNIK